MFVIYLYNSLGYDISILFYFVLYRLQISKGMHFSLSLSLPPPIERDPSIVWHIKFVSLQYKYLFFSNLITSPLKTL